jgi:ribosomal protein L40E
LSRKEAFVSADVDAAKNVCLKCGAENALGAEICAQCGEALPKAATKKKRPLPPKMNWGAQDIGRGK